MSNVKIFHKTKLPTKQALALSDALERNGIKTKLELFDGHKHIDITVPSARLDIEIDGISHLINHKQIVADLNRGYYSHHSGYNTMHIPNEMVDKYLEKIAKALAETCKIRAEKLHIHLS